MSPPSQPPSRRSRDGFLVPGAKPREPALVKETPGLVRIGTELTDGENGYRVVDSMTRHGAWWVELENIETKQRAAFAVRDIGELAFGRGERRAPREDLQR